MLIVCKWSYRREIATLYFLIAKMLKKKKDNKNNYVGWIILCKLLLWLLVLTLAVNANIRHGNLKGLQFYNELFSLDHVYNPLHVTHTHTLHSLSEILNHENYIIPKNKLLFKLFTNLTLASKSIFTKKKAKCQQWSNPRPSFFQEISILVNCLNCLPDRNNVTLYNVETLFKQHWM